MNISSLSRELSGPRPLRRGVGLQIAHLESGTLAFLLESQPTFTTAGGGKGGKPTSAALYTGVGDLDTQFSSFVCPRDGEVLRY